MLASLNPKWTGLLRPDSGEGVELDCPNCGSTHRLVAFFSNPLDGKDPAPWQKPIWERIGETLDVLTVTPSLQYPCFHGWIENGRVFDVSESPLRMMVDGKIASASPMQAIALIQQMLATDPERKDA